MFTLLELQTNKKSLSCVRMLDEKVSIAYVCWGGQGRFNGTHHHLDPNPPLYLGFPF